VLVISFIALLNGLCELLNVFDFFLVLIVDLLDNFERAMALAEDPESFFSAAFATLLVHLHAVVSSLGALYVEKDLTILFVALYCGTHVDTLLTTDYAPNVEF